MAGLGQRVISTVHSVRRHVELHRHRRSAVSPGDPMTLLNFGSAKYNANRKYCDED